MMDLLLCGCHFHRNPISVSLRAKYKGNAISPQKQEKKKMQISLWDLFLILHFECNMNANKRRKKHKLELYSKDTLI